MDSTVYWLCLAAVPSLLSVIPAHAEVRVPAFTAYLEPRTGGARISNDTGITGWRDPDQKVVWYGLFKNTGVLHCSVALRPRTEPGARLRLTVAGQTREGGANRGLVSFEAVNIATPGYQRFALELLDGFSAGVDALILDGPAAVDAHFNMLMAQRGAPSVHMWYPVPAGIDVAAFYCEVTAIEDPVPTYYMATGWNCGYFGMQVNSPTERRIIFSVWDSGSEAKDRSKVADEDRTKLVAKGKGVFSGDFGNEGTGGHSHLVYPWKTGEKQKFIVTAKVVDPTHTIYSGYWFHPEQKRWMLISSWDAPKTGDWLRGLYSFSEDFGGTGTLRRKALFGNQWIRTTGGEWIELTKARFSHTGKTERLDRCMGVENGQFFLAAGGFVPGTTEAGEEFTRPATGHAPDDIDLPALPQ